MTVRSMTFRYAASLILLAVVVAANYHLAEQRIEATKFISSVMDNMGQQRMLSQRVAVLSQSLVEAKHESGRNIFKKELLELSDRLEKTHNDLLAGELSKKLP